MISVSPPGPLPPATFSTVDRRRIDSRSQSIDEIWSPRLRNDHRRRRPELRIGLRHVIYGALAVVAVPMLWAITRTSDPRALGPFMFSFSSFGNLISLQHGASRSNRGTCTTSPAPSANSRPGTPRGNGRGVGGSVALGRGWRGIGRFLVASMIEPRGMPLPLRLRPHGVGSPKRGREGQKDYPVSALASDGG